MISFVQESYSPHALVLIPVAATIISFAWKWRKWSFIQICLLAVLASPALYVIGSTFIEGPSAFMGLIYAFAMVIQIPIVLVTAGLIELFRRGPR